MKKEMFFSFIRKVFGRYNIFLPEVMICVPIEVTDVEKRAVLEAALNAGAAYVAHTSDTLEEMENSVKPERPPSKLGIVRPPKFRPFKT